MKYLTRMLAYTRFLQLKRQWKLVSSLLARWSRDQQPILAALIYGEATRAGKHPMPQFYASSAVEAYRPWGDAVDRAFERIRGSDEKDQARGLATWLAVVYHETSASSAPGLRELNKAVGAEMRRFRALHERVLAIRLAA